MIQAQTPEETAFDELYHTGSQLSTSTVVFGLLNGMIGGTILILPLLGLTTGYLMSALTCIIIGLVCYYTAYLVIVHLGKGTVRDWILEHFDHDEKYLVGFNIIMVINGIPGYLIYFKLVCLQIESLLGVDSIWIPVGVSAVFFILIVLMRIFHFGEESLAFGLLTIMSYLVFLIWVQITAPSGPNVVPQQGNPLNLSSTLLFAYAVHTLLMQNILKNPNKSQYVSVVKYTFFFGTLIYLFILMGSYAIVNRTPVDRHPQIINDYFPVGQWQVMLIEIIYLFHLFTVQPMNVIVSKIRFFQIFGLEVKRYVDLKEVIYIACIVVFGLLFEILNVSIQAIINFDGAFILVLLDVILPMWIHYRCIFKDRHSGYIEDDEEWNASIQPNKCQCDVRYRSKWMLYLETFMMVVITIGSIFLMASTLITI